MSDQLELNKQVARDFLQAVCVGDAERADELVADDLMYEIKGTTVIAGVRGKPELLEIARMIDQFLDGVLVFEDEIITAEADRVSFAAQGRSTLVSGGSYDNTYHLLFRIRDGKVSELHEYIDTKYTDEVLAPLMAEVAEA